MSWYCDWTFITYDFFLEFKYFWLWYFSVISINFSNFKLLKNLPGFPLLSSWKKSKNIPILFKCPKSFSHSHQSPRIQHTNDAGKHKQAHRHPQHSWDKVFLIFLCFNKLQSAAYINMYVHMFLHWHRWWYLISHFNLLHFMLFLARFISFDFHQGMRFFVDFTHFTLQFSL